jgi:hypothetical protein
MNVTNKDNNSQTHTHTPACMALFASIGVPVKTISIARDFPTAFASL